MKKNFRFRGFVSLLNTFSFIISLISGIVLYFTPQGKIAHWTNWTYWGLDKETWGALHINSSLIFFIIAVFHIYYNWRAITGYIYSRFKKAMNLKLELALALVFSLFIIWASVADIQPFATIIRWNTDIKDYWAYEAENQPPIPHAEEMTVTEFCKQINLDIERFEQSMQRHNWKFSPEQTIKTIAQNNNISPADIYRATQAKQQSNASGQGAGWGQKSVAQVCNEAGIDVQTGLDRLKSGGITASANDNLRTLASRAQTRPNLVAEIILNKKIEH